MNIKQALSAVALAATVSTGAQAGNIYLTGHDVLLHSGQSGYDNIILEYLRNGVGTAGTYDIGVVTRSGGSVTGLGTLGVSTLEGFGSIDQRALDTFADGTAFASYLAGIDVLVIPSNNRCGGCNLFDADLDILEGFSAEIAAFFNADGDIYGNSGSTDTSYYNFLPPSAATSGPSISGSTGFTATAAGTAIGIVSGNINGFATHNRFTGFDPAFTVFETRRGEDISIGLLDAVITTGGIDPTTGGTTTGGTVPEPATLTLLGLGALGLSFMRRKKR